MKNVLHISLLLSLIAALRLFSTPALAQGAPEEDMSVEASVKFADTRDTDIDLYNQIIADKNRVKSLFFLQGEIMDIHLAINTFLKHSGRGDLNFDEEAFLRRLNGLKRSGNNAAQLARYYTYPQFFLDSIVYHSPDDWIIWLNGNKITQATPQENTDIAVIAIDADKVALQWSPIVMEKINETWNQLPNDEVEVDAAGGKVFFTLKPNQTFSSYVMKVLEGKVLPVTVDLTANKMPIGGAEEPETETPAPAPETEAPSADTAPEQPAKAEGLSGLISSYRNLKTGDEK